ncbi:hypothetical protein D8B26_003164 [Coccidioides posadasii str. Silveira]|uniref:Uncharacterized protein n=3 Tax=Coccidioides posadasii TaxID=199306 RepID=E9CZ14_COCPS|nr:conserved hypothetical protein [Coccidioides posadasii str. Silveira]KMM72974.1 RTA1 domain-containing protein [Coccidioides posadasii RMSCC 3488]QVM08474.1 hypothetical protein D8B26_003164 [Coccidioides posadasii str. Silveira]
MTNRCDAVDFNDDNVPWAYCPSFPAAILFAAIFCLLTIAHTAQLFLSRKKFCWVIVMAAIWETIGFSLRAYSTQNLRSIGPVVPSQLLIILSPLWLNAFVYMVLGRMIYFFLPEKRCFGISAKKLTMLFVILDITAFLVQGTGGSMLSGDDPKTVNLGKYIYMGGIGFQEFFILIFFALAVRFHYKMNYVETIHPPAYRWRPLLYTVYAGLVLITIRVIYRLCEYSQGVDTPLSKSETAFYVLDAATMAVAIFLFSIFHPGRFLVGPDSEFPKKQKKSKANRNRDDTKSESRRSKRWVRRRTEKNDVELSTEAEQFAAQELGQHELLERPSPGSAPGQNWGYR